MIDFKKYVFYLCMFLNCWFRLNNEIKTQYNNAIKVQMNKFCQTPIVNHCEPTVKLDASVQTNNAEDIKNSETFKENQHDCVQCRKPNFTNNTTKLMWMIEQLENEKGKFSSILEKKDIEIHVSFLFTTNNREKVITSSFPRWWDYISYTGVPFKWKLISVLAASCFISSANKSHFCTPPCELNWKSQYEILHQEFHLRVQNHKTWPRSQCLPSHGASLSCSTSCMR